MARAWLVSLFFAVAAIGATVHHDNDWAIAYFGATNFWVGILLLGRLLELIHRDR